MSSELISLIKRVAAGLINQRAHGRWGIVESVNPDGPLVRVMIQPDNVLSGWIPVLQQAAGAGATFLTVPEPGWQAFLNFDHGEHEHGVVVGFAHNDGAALPALPNAPGSGGTPSAGKIALAPGESAFLGPFGSAFRFNANGDIFMQPGSGTLKIDGHLTVNGNVTAQQNITAVQQITDLNGTGGGGTLSALRTAYDNHRHGDVVNGGGTTDVTTLPV